MSSTGLSLQMRIRKISGFIEMWGLTRSSLLRSQIFYVYRPRPPAFRYVPIVRGSGVSEQGPPLFAGLSLEPVLWCVFDQSPVVLVVSSCCVFYMSHAL